MKKSISCIALAAQLAWIGGAAMAQNAAAQNAVGEVTYVQGLTSARRPGQETRFLAAGDPIAEGEVISTIGRGYAVIGLKDGTRMTLRPSTSFAVEQLSQKAGEETLAMSLLRGGLRAVTGLISKAGPNRARVVTPTATVGIRGTEFDARLCGADCRVEALGARAMAPPAATQPVVARVAVLVGGASALAANGATRSLAPGAALFSGESVRTAASSYAVLAFRDESKVTLAAATEMKLEDVRFAPAQPDEGNFVVRLVTGGMRAVTGLLSKRDPRSVRVLTPTATVGIRGTGVDVRTLDNRDYVYTWDGVVALEANGRELVIVKDRAAVFDPARGTIEMLDAIPRFFLDEPAPRPDLINVDFKVLFAIVAMDDYAPGLYVGVRSGNVNLGGLIDLGPFEAAFLAEGSDRPVRIEPPGFLFGDRIPTPDSANLRPLRLIELLGPGLSDGDWCEIK